MTNPIYPVNGLEHYSMEKIKFATNEAMNRCSSLVARLLKAGTPQLVIDAVENAASGAIHVFSESLIEQFFGKPTQAERDAWHEFLAETSRRAEVRSFVESLRDIYPEIDISTEELYDQLSAIADSGADEVEVNEAMTAIFASLIPKDEE